MCVDKNGDRGCVCAEREKERKRLCDSESVCRER